MFQFTAFPILPDLYKEVPLRNSGFNTFMRFAQTFRSLTRPSSALEPSYPPDSLHYLCTVSTVWSRSMTYLFQQAPTLVGNCSSCDENKVVIFLKHGLVGSHIRFSTLSATVSDGHSFHSTHLLGFTDDFIFDFNWTRRDSNPRPPPIFGFRQRLRKDYANLLSYAREVLYQAELRAREHCGSVFVL